MREGRIDLGEANVVGAASLFDFSNYPSNHPCFSEENKMVPGKNERWIDWKCDTGI